MRVLLPQSGAEANVSASVSLETLEALDHLMTKAAEMFPLESAPPKAKPCGYLNCRHSRRQHLHKRKKRGGVDYHYGACRVRGCKCPTYYEAGVEAYERD